MLNYILNHLHFQRKDLIKNITKIYSPNFNARPSNININTVIIHYTELDEQDAIEHFCNKSSKVSSHFLINKNGKIVKSSLGAEDWDDEEFVKELKELI